MSDKGAIIHDIFVFLFNIKDLWNKRLNSFSIKVREYSPSHFSGKEFLRKPNSKASTYLMDL